jgi:hypothetical protein
MQTMSLVNIKNALTSRTAMSLLKVSKHSPTILFVAGAIGVAATVVLACRATLKVEDVIEETGNNLELINMTPESDDYTSTDRSRDKAMAYGQAAGHFALLYGPALVVGVASITALTGSHIILRRRNIALTAAYAVLDKGFNEYRRRVTEKYGIVEDQTMRHGLVDKTIVEETPTGPVTRIVKAPGSDAPSIYARLFDEGNRNWNRHPAYNPVFLNCQKNYANDLLRSRGHIFLNEVYDMLGMDRSKEGTVVGWLNNNPNGDGYVDFGVFAGDTYMGQLFVNGDEKSVWLDFNVDGVIYDLI